MADITAKKVYGVPVRIPETLLEAVRDEAYRIRKATGKEPTYGEVLSIAWEMYSNNENSQENIEKLLQITKPADTMNPTVASWAEDILAAEALLDHRWRGMLEHIREQLKSVAEVGRREQQSTSAEGTPSTGDRLVPEHPRRVHGGAKQA